MLLKRFIGWLDALAVLAFVVVGSGFLARERDGKEVADEGAYEPQIAQSEILTVYAPQALIDFARNNRNITSQEVLLQKLEQEGLSKVWLATKTKLDHTDGTSIIVPLAFRPGERPMNLDETCAAMETLAGDPPRTDAMDCSRAEVVPIDDATGALGPFEGMRKLLKR